MIRIRLFILTLLLTACCLPASGAEFQSRLRRPIAIAVSSDGKWLFAANRDSGSISIVDLPGGTVAKEIDVGGRTSDLVAIDDSRLLVLDEQNHQLVLYSGGGVDWKVASRLDVAQYPVCLKVDRAAQRCFISSLWSQTVTIIDLPEIDPSKAAGDLQPDLAVTKELMLPFECRELCLASEGTKLMVAGAFNSSLAVIDTDTLELIAIKQLPGHNIGGLAMSGDGKRVLISQQHLNPLAQSTQDDVHWGNMLSNLLVSIRLDEVCDNERDLLPSRIPFQLGEPGNAAGDPGPILVAPAGKMVVVLSGVGEIALGGDNDFNDLKRISVGRRPTAVTSTAKGRIYVANTFSDSISVIDAENAKEIDRISLGPLPELNLAQRGEELFFDSRLSHDGWMSCHSCHTEGHTNGQLNDNLSDGTFGAPKRVLSLLGVGETGPWAWNGRVKKLEEQVSNSIEKTMHGTSPGKEQVAALVAYLKTLPAAPAASMKIRENAAKIERGQQLFRSLECQRCHTPPTYTSSQAYDVGLTDAVGNKKFNPPSLRGVGRRKSFFHDGRATSLPAVLGEHQHQLPRNLSKSELDDLLHFLRSL